MRLSSFKIQHFKSIINTGQCHLSDTDNVLVLAGQNEAGKSAVVEALNFFRNGPSEDFDKLHRRKDEHPEVVCHFLLDDVDIENIFNESENQKLKDFLTKNKEISFKRGSISEDKFEKIVLTDDFKDLIKDFFLVPTTPPALAAQIPVTTTIAEPAADETADTTTTTTTDPPKEPYSINNLEWFLVPEIRKFLFFDLFNDLLPSEVKITDIPKYPAVQDFEKVYNVNFANIVTKEPRDITREELRINNAATDDLNTYWRQKLEEGSKYNYKVKIIASEKVKFGDPPQEAQTEAKVEFYIDRDDEDPLYLEQKSKGFRWFSSFNLKLRAFGAEDNFIKNLVILIDEPGHGLHEKAQLDVKEVIEELAKKGAQVIYATHYANLIGTEGKEFARIRLVSNSKKKGTVVQNPAQYASSTGSKDALSPIITAMGIQSVGSILDQQKLNVVVEGITDHYYLASFKKLLNKDERLAFLPACGVTNVPNLVCVLIGWACKYKSVFDDDPGSGRKAYNLLKNEFYEKSDEIAQKNIYKLSGCNGIEDIFESEDFYKFVLNEEVPLNKSAENSKIAEGRKELLARLFLDKVEKGEVELSSKTVKRIDEVFKWLYEKFNIQTDK
jgi:AAA15 family ATPase/GTPase